MHADLIANSHSIVMGEIFQLYQLNIIAVRHVLQCILCHIIQPRSVYTCACVDIGRVEREFKVAKFF